MGGLFGVTSKEDCVTDLFFGTDYHSHLGPKRGGMCLYEKPYGFNRSIHNIENSPFRTEFEKEVNTFKGNSGIGSISDGDPQPLTVHSSLGDFAIGTVGRINNKAQLVNELVSTNQFMTMSGNQINNTELVASLVSKGSDIAEGIRYAQEKIEGSMTILILTDKGIYGARDKYGRTPLIIGKGEYSRCIASESFSFINIGFQFERELGPGEIVFLTPEGIEEICKPHEKMRVCTFLWTYFGYTTSTYEGQNVEITRYRNGALMAKRDKGLEVDYVSGVPDSGVAHALGYANAASTQYARPLIKYTPTWPRSFMPPTQRARELIAKMKLIPVFEIINNSSFVLVDDSIVRGTQLSGTVKYLHENGANEIHVRSASPPIMYGCKYLHFARSVKNEELKTRNTIARLEGVDISKISDELLIDYSSSNSERNRSMIDLIRQDLDFNSLKFQRLEDLLESVGIDRCKLCTYCWDGKE